MKRIRKVKITTTRRQSGRLQPLLTRAHCHACGREVETLTAAQATEILEVDADAVSRLIDEGLIHAISTVSGSFRVCKNSLFP